MTKKKDSILKDIYNTFKRYTKQKTTKGENLVNVIWTIILVTIVWLVIFSRRTVYDYVDMNNKHGESYNCYYELNDKKMYCLVETEVKQYSVHDE